MWIGQQPQSLSCYLSLKWGYQFVKYGLVSPAVSFFSNRQVTTDNLRPFWSTLSFLDFFPPPLSGQEMAAKRHHQADHCSLSFSLLPLMLLSLPRSRKRRKTDVQKAVDIPCQSAWWMMLSISLMDGATSMALNLMLIWLQWKISAFAQNVTQSVCEHNFSVILYCFAVLNPSTTSSLFVAHKLHILVTDTFTH